MSNETKTSPGPWIVQVPPTACQTVRFVVSDAGAHVCKVGHMDYTSGSQESDIANAALIAAAPELLAALEVLVEHAQETYPHFESERGQRDIKQALAAIAKATGGA